MLRRLCFAITTGLYCACSLALSFDGISGGLTGDAGTEAQAGDAPVDVITSEGGADVVSEDTGAPGPYCASLSPAATFCDDFDTADLSSKWTQVTQTNGTVNRVGDATQSPPMALQIRTNTQSTTARAQPYVRKTLPSFANKRLRGEIELDVKVTETDPATSVTLAIFVIEGSPGYSEWQFQGYESAGQIRFIFSEFSNGTDAGPQYRGVNLGPSVPKGVWTHVKVTWTYDTLGGTAGNRASVYINGTLELDNRAFLLPAATGSPALDVGVTYIEAPSNPWTIRFDDVALWLNPL
jgi:hypothetical protein